MRDSTKVICPTAGEWAVIKPFLEKLLDAPGALVIPPDVAGQLRSATGREPAAEILGYDFGGGSPDVQADVVPEEEFGSAALEEAELLRDYEESVLSPQGEAACRAFGIKPSWWRE